MKLILLFVIIVCSAAAPVFCQETTAANAEKEAAYTRTIHSRAEKIVTTLNLHDSPKSTRLVNIIAGQYRNLNTIHTELDEQLKAARQSGEEKSAVDAKVKAAEEAATAKLDRLHQSYLAQLNAELTAEQVDQVKDGMTYGVLPITYKGYQEMIPTLTDEQKQQIKTWLIEAREHAMDAASSEKKHWWFGKYKGRINNYLSSAGYDLKKEGDAWEKRRQEAKEKTKNQNKS